MDKQRVEFLFRLLDAEQRVFARPRVMAVILAELRKELEVKVNASK